MQAFAHAMRVLSASHQSC